ncbi:MAG: hypothetical protein ABIR47_16505 [Candidatus Kapaibacterium sp.]
MVLLLLMLPLSARAQFFGSGITIYPDELYSGLNTVTITAPEGLASIQFTDGRGSPGPLLTGRETSQYRVVTGPTFTRCATKTTFMIYVKDISRTLSLYFRVADCEGNSSRLRLSMDETWEVFREDFGTVVLGAPACHMFTVASRMGDFILDSVASPSKLFTIHYTAARPPLRLHNGQQYHYDVCYIGTRTGPIKMPIFTYLRRSSPAGGMGTFLVADTALINVVLPRERPIAVNRPPVRPRPQVLLAPPVDIIIPKAIPRPVVKIDTPRVIPKVIASRARSVAVILPSPVSVSTGTAPIPAPPLPDEPIADPTTHRVLLMPTARSIDSGKFFVANYDLAGFLVGAGLGDRTTLLGGVLYVPGSTSHNLVLTGGGRYEVYRKGIVRGAVGAQAGYSESNISSIILASPYAVISVGDDDRRASLAAGYSWRRHTPKDTLLGPFSQQAAVLAVGGDYRIGGNWKIVGEAYLLQDASYRPLVVTLRYFTSHLAIDGGVGVDLGIAGEARRGVTVLPVITATWVF